MSESSPSRLLARLVAPGPDRDRGGWRTVAEGLTADGWSAVLASARRHGLLPLLESRVGRDATLGPRLPVSVRSALTDGYLHSRLRSRSLRAQLREILEALEEAGASAIALKGAYLGEAVYGDPALRPHNDLDLLCLPSEISTVSEVMEGLGYTPREGNPYVDYERLHHLAPFDRPGSVPVEIHRGLVAPDGGARLPVEELWERATEVSLAECDARALAPEDQLLHLCAHMAVNHTFDVPLLHLCDVAYASRTYGSRVDWALLKRRARDTGLGEAVDLVFAVVRSTLGDGALPRTAGGGRPDELTRHVRDQVYAFGAEEPPLPTAVRSLLRAEGAAGKAGALLRTLFPPKDELARIHDRPSESDVGTGIRILRPLQIAARLPRSLWNLIRRASTWRSALRIERTRVRVSRRLAAD